MFEHRLQETPFSKVVNTSFPHCPAGPMGVGVQRQLMVGMDRYFDTSKFAELHSEVVLGLAKSRNWGFGKVLGTLPPELAAERKSDFPGPLLENLSALDPSGSHRAALNSIHDHDTLWRYACFALGAVVPWFFTLYLRGQLFVQKQSLEGQAMDWLPEAENFPKLVKFIEQDLPFASIGRVMFFATFPGAGVPAHRDYVVAPHKDHNINFFFDSWRPSFIYDELTKTKHYLEKPNRSYFFNNRDYHGCDPESVFRYTLRVDGTFKDEICRDLGMDAGYVFNWDYLKSN